MVTQIIDFPECEAGYRDFNLRQHRMLAQHSWAWQKMLAVSGQWRWRAVALFDATSTMIGCLPFCERETDIGKVLMSSPFPASYAGVLHVEDCDPEHVYARLLSALLEYANDNWVDIVSLFTSPFRDDERYYRKYLQPTHVFDKFYQYLDENTNLDRPSSSNFRENLRKHLKRARENDLQVHYLSNPDTELLSEWYNNVLTPRFEDIGAPITPFMVYKAIADHLGGEDLFEFAFVEYQGKMVAGGLFLYAWCQDVYFKASITEYMKAGAGILLDYSMLKRGRERNVKAYNFLSSPSRKSPVYTYKKRWGCIEGNTYYYSKVLTDSGKFIKAGKQAVSRSFPHFFVLPYFVYEDDK